MNCLWCVFFWFLGLLPAAQGDSSVCSRDLRRAEAVVQEKLILAAERSGQGVPFMFAVPRLRLEEQRLLFRVVRVWQAERAHIEERMKGLRAQSLTAAVKRKNVLSKKINGAKDVLIRSMVAWGTRRAKKISYVRLLDPLAVESAILEGIEEAFEKFDLSRGTKFSTYVSWTVYGKVSRLWVRKAKERGNISVDAEGADPGLTDSMEGPVESAHHSEVKSILSKVLGRLDPQHQDVLRLLYGLDGNRPLTQVEVAETYGITRQAISVREKKALARLSEMSDIQKLWRSETEPE